MPHITHGKIAFNNFKFISVVVIVLGISAFVMSSSGKGEDAKNVEPAEKPSIAVEVFGIEAPTERISLKYHGYIVASSKALVVSKVSGLIERKMPVEGQQVKKGDLILKIDEEPYVYTFIEAKQKVKKELSLLEKINKDVERNDSLSRLGHVSQSNIDDLRYKQKEVEANVAILRSNESNAQYQLSNTSVVAPFSGQVGFINKDPGGYVNVGEPLAEIIDDSKVFIEFSIPESDYYTINNSIGSKELNSKSFIDVSINNREDISVPLNMGTKSIRKDLGDLLVRIEVDNQSRMFLNGSFCQVDLKIKPSNFLYALPKTAVVFKSGLPFIFKFSAGNVAEEVAVNVLREDPEYYYLDKGVGSGDKVITNNLAFLEKGTKVHLKN